MTFIIICILFAMVGISILVIQTRDIFSNPQTDFSGGFFRARDKDSQKLLWPHWTAAYLTAIMLVALPVLIFLDVEPAQRILSFAAGALFYVSLRGLGWSFSSRERYPYIAPILFALLLSLAYLVLLLFPTMHMTAW